MRGRRDPQLTMLAFIDLEERVPLDHPLRTIKALADRALAELSPTFDRMYAEGGRPSIPPERLLKASSLREPDWVSLGQQLGPLERLLTLVPSGFSPWSYWPVMKAALPDGVRSGNLPRYGTPGCPA